MKQNREAFENCCADFETKWNWGIRPCKRNIIGLINVQDPRVAMANSQMSTSSNVKQLKTIIPREWYEQKWSELMSMNTLHGILETSSWNNCFYNNSRKFTLCIAEQRSDLLTLHRITSERSWPLAQRNQVVFSFGTLLFCYHYNWHNCLSLFFYLFHLFHISSLWQHNHHNITPISTHAYTHNIQTYIYTKHQAVLYKNKHNIL